jgi:hypothetical protein
LLLTISGYSYYRQLYKLQGKPGYYSQLCKKTGFADVPIPRWILVMVFIVSERNFRDAEPVQGCMYDPGSLLGTLPFIECYYLPQSEDLNSFPCLLQAFAYSKGFCTASVTVRASKGQ